MGDGNAVHVTRAGRTQIGLLEIEALYVPQFRIFLISVSKLASKNLQTIFNRMGCTVTVANGQALLKDNHPNGLYFTTIQCKSTLVTTRSQICRISQHDEVPYPRSRNDLQSDSLELWH